jgi:L-lactate dehydrogenase (cytochrome)
LWGLGAAGQAGVSRVLALLRDELVRSMQLAGCADVTAIDRDLVRRSRLFHR